MQCKLPQRGLGRSPSWNQIWCILARKSDIVSLLKIFPFLFLKVSYHNHVMAMSSKYCKRRSVSQTLSQRDIHAFIRVSTPALSTPALSTLVISCCVVHSGVFHPSLRAVLSTPAFSAPPSECLSSFLRATAVPAGTAEARISYGNSVCPSVCHDPVVYQDQVR